MFIWGCIILFLVWLFYSLSAYYVVQKPFTVPQLFSLADTAAAWWRFPFSLAAAGRSLLDVAFALWIGWVALGIGLYGLKWLGLKLDSALAILLYGLGLGFGCLGLLVLFLGMLGWLQTAVIYAFMSLLTAVTLLPVIRFLPRIRPSRPSRLAWLYLSLAVGMALFIALLPPISWDGLFYHLKGPKLYLEAGRIVGGIDIPHLNFPSLFEMLFMLAMALRGDVTAKLIHFAFHGLLAGLVYLVARDVVRVPRPGTAVLVLYSIPMMLHLGAHAYNDLALAFYQVAALVALSQWQQRKDRRWLVLCGIWCGLAMGLKYTSFVTPLVITILLIWHFRHRLPQMARPLLTIAIPTALVAAPWYIKNWFFTGNPFYPFLFNGRFWDAYRSAAYAGTGTGIGFDPIALLRLPHDLILGLQDASGDGQPGPLFLIFLPLIIVYAFSRLGRRAERPFFQLLVFVLVSYLFWAYGVIFSGGLRQTRLLLPAFVALCPLLAWILADLAQFDHSQFSLHRFITLVIGIALAMNLLAQFLGWLPGAPWAYVLGEDSRDDVLQRYLGPHYSAMQGINSSLPEDAVVVFLYEPRSYYCERDCRPDSILDKLSHLEYLHQDAAGIAAAWREAKVSHVLLFDAGYDFVVNADMAWITPRDLTLLDRLRQDYWRPVAAWEDDYTLYELLP